MLKPLSVPVMVCIGAFALLFAAQTLPDSFAAEQTKKEKQPKAAPPAKAATPKTDKHKYQSAETAGKGKTCYGLAPKIEKLTPDEGKAGDKVTIKGTEFGSPDCLRSVSFGPSHPASFKMQNATTITTTVPAGGRKGLAMVTVTTASGEDSKAFLLK
jgi:hypothetical protein